MSDIDIAWQAAQDAAQALAPEADLVGRSDMAGFGGSLLTVFNRALAAPFTLAEASLRLAHLARATQFAAARAMGSRAAPPDRTGPDKRFADPAWEDNPAFAALRQYYLATRQFTGEVLDAAGATRSATARPGWPPGSCSTRSAPTNFLATNPAALKRAFETGGGSLVAGTRNFLDDLVNNNGRPRQVDTSPFHLGENMAATPGQVVYTSDLMELIQYAPQTPQVHSDPDAGQPAVDQQVLHHGPGARPQLHRVGRAARAHGLRHLLPQPRVGDARCHPGRLPDRRAERGARRDLGYHRVTQDQHYRALPGRRADRHAGLLPGPHRG